MEEYDVNGNNETLDSIHYQKRKIGNKIVAIVRYTHKMEPEVLRKNDLKWTSISDPNNNSYARAYFLGQGCWEDLYEISEEEANDLLNEWGYKEDL